LTGRKYTLIQDYALNRHMRLLTSLYGIIHHELAGFYCSRFFDWTTNRPRGGNNKEWSRIPYFTQGKVLACS